MTLEDQIPTESITEKLRNLCEYLPNKDQTLYDFAAYFADRVRNSPLTPKGFVLAAQVALYDLGTGVDGFTRKPINNGLVGYPPIIYQLLGMQVPDLAAAVCPADFAQSVREFQTKVDAKVAANLQEN